MKNRYDSKDQYCYDGTDILINKFDLRDIKELLIKERKITSLNTIKIYSEIDIDNTIMDLKTYLYIHKTLFKEVYSFAGEIRNVVLSKGNTRFCEAQYIDKYLKKIFYELKADDYLKGLSKKEFVEKIGYYYSELNAIHPFREGNGRTNRIFIDLLAKKNNLNLNIEKWKEKEQISAMIDAMSGNTKKLLKMINKYII